MACVDFCFNMQGRVPSYVHAMRYGCNLTYREGEPGTSRSECAPYRNKYLSLSIHLRLRRKCFEVIHFSLSLFTFLLACFDRANKARRRDSDL